MSPRHRKRLLDKVTRTVRDVAPELWAAGLSHPNHAVLLTKIIRRGFAVEARRYEARKAAR